MQSGAVETHRRGVILVLAAAFCWSSGGVIARFFTVDVWSQVCGRGFFALITLLLFLLLRDGRNTIALFRNLGLPGIVVGVCFGFASTSFVIALQTASVATILVIQSTAPLIAGVIAWLWMRETLGWTRIVAMLVALFGVWQMVSGGATGGDATGVALSCGITLALGIATVTVRRYHTIRMTPAACIAAAIQLIAGLALRESGPVPPTDIFLMFLFGAGQLAIGMIFFTFGARLIPAGEAALLGLLECVLGPIWVWVFVGEDPGSRAIIGGALTLAAVAGNTIYEMSRTARDQGIKADRTIGGPV